MVVFIVLPCRIYISDDSIHFHGITLAMFRERMYKVHPCQGVGNHIGLLYQITADSAIHGIKALIAKGNFKVLLLGL